MPKRIWLLLILSVKGIGGTLVKVSRPSPPSPPTRSILLLTGAWTCILAGEAVDELDQLFDDIEERWGLLDQLYKKATLQAAEKTTASKATSSDEAASQKSSLPPTPPPPSPLSGKSSQSTSPSSDFSPE